MESATKGKAKRRHLDAEDCDDLRRSPEGASTLTRPYAAPHASRGFDPYRGFYPWTPPKKQRFGLSLLESPDKHQRGVASFFPVTGVVSTSPQKSSPQKSSSSPRTSSSSPHTSSPRTSSSSPCTSFPCSSGVVGTSPQKSAQPCTSSSSPRTSFPCSSGAFTPKKEVKVEEEEEDDYDEEDSMSLLATPKKEVKVEEEEEDEDEEDSMSLLATPIKEEGEEEVDYLEGMTAEMFGDDDEMFGNDDDFFEREFFECGFDDNDAGASVSAERGPGPARTRRWEAAEVEPLPDSHYGLLGTRRGLLEPRGRMEDLPEEVLRQVLSPLSAQDLYRHVSLVCHRWRDVVQDPKFVPCKKKYYRYLMKDKDTSSDLKLVLEKNGVLGSSTKGHMLHLVFMMSHHKSSDRLRPEDVLQCVKRHRLFPQAEACLRLRRPHIQLPGLGLEGPYAAMAVILLISEGVWDVQSLVSHLRVCMSTTAVTEYLCQMATFLLAMMRNNVGLSNRLHYNIYYVLHLMENAPSSASVGQDRRPRVRMTHEQQQILNHDIRTDHVVKVMAFAGTGKTTMLVQYAQQRPHLRFLYAAFNKSVAVEAKRRFPSNVACKTIHSMAFRDVGWRYQKKLTFNLRAFSVAWVLPPGRGGFTNAKVVTQTLSAYMASADRDVDVSHVPNTMKNNKGRTEELDYHRKEGYRKDAQAIWDKMKDPKESKDGYRMPHDGYQKLWQLRQPKPFLTHDYDVIFIDEAQDCTPAVMDVLLAQRCGKVLVGDPHQQIYTFRGAVNALHSVPHTHIYYLTQSFRFGAEIAYIGATILHVFKKVSKYLVGGHQEGSVWGEGVDTVAPATSRPAHARGKTTAILSRSNVTVFNEAVRLTDANPRCRLHIIGGADNFGLNKILDIWRLMGGSNEVQCPFLRTFLRRKHGGYQGLKQYACRTEDLELVAKLTVVERFNSRIPELVNRIYGASENDYRNADFILGTVHKAKGLEFDTVVVSDDFAKVPTARHNLGRVNFAWSDVPDDEWNLLYVAVTRAKTSLVLSKSISYILTLAGEYMLKSEMPSALLKGGAPPSCCVRECRNAILPDSAFTMCKRTIRYVDRVEEGGPLCERCVWQRIGPSAYLLTDQMFSLPETREQLDLPVLSNMLLALF